MDLDFGPEERKFRDEVRTWLRESVPTEPRPLEGLHAGRDYDMAWQCTQFDAGWAGISWPKEYGGAGLSLLQQMIWHEEYARAGAPGINTGFVGLNHAGPTLITCGDEDQKRFHLPAILRGEAVWCQGFSEPTAGSDLAGLKTRAVFDGDDLVVTGQKIWTSFANVAEYQELLVRTDPEAPRPHRGITWVIGDMRLPGIEIRPITTMAGGREFCEVFYDEVRIPKSHVVGEVNGGWGVAMSTLGFERGTAFMASQLALAKRVEDLVELARTTTGPDGKRPAIAHDEIALEVGRVRAEVAALRAMTLAGVSRAARSPVPGAEGSLIKLYYSDVSKRVGRLAMQVLGAKSAIWEGETDDWVREYLGSYAITIAGGTSEIQRNIIGERLLGLPRDR